MKDILTLMVVGHGVLQISREFRGCIGHLRLEGLWPNVGSGCG